MSTPCSQQTNLCGTNGYSSCPNAQPLPKWLISSDRRGWRRLVQNFTPSWVLTISIPTTSRKLQLTFLPVCSNNGYRHSLHPSPHAVNSLPPLPQHLAGPQHRIFHNKHLPLHRHPNDLDPALHTLPCNMDPYASPPSPIAVPRHTAHGLRDACEHVCSSVRAGVGRVDGLCSVGNVVG
jgi:hypothetical protein